MSGARATGQAGPNAGLATRAQVVSALRSAQKSNRGAAGYSRWVNRPLGRQAAALAYLRGLSPNQVSLLSAACTFPGIALIAAAPPTWLTAIIVTVLLVAGYALDSADGQVARLRGGGSPDGEWLDHVLDSAKIAVVHLAVAISWFRFFALPSAWVLVPLAFGAVSTVFFFAQVLADMIRRVERVRAGGSGVTTSRVNPNEPAPVLRSLVVLPNDYGVLCLLMLLLPVSVAFQSIYTVFLAANALFLVVGSMRWFREMRALREPAESQPEPAPAVAVPTGGRSA